jgi:hypothetical protein
MNEKLVELGLSIDYPIEWDMEMILRDLMQNFFDAIGYERFAEDFIYSVSGTEKVDCIMAAKGHSFSYEWLTSIGGSTKKPGENIGYYGEGFKMCMLRLIQLSIVECTMESEDWILRPCVYYEKVSDNRVGMLGYRVSEREDDGNTRLTIKGIPGEHRYLFNEIPCNFFYHSNTLFGEMLIDEDNFCVYTRNNKTCPGYEFSFNRYTGLLYINDLARAVIDMPLAINIRGVVYSDDERSRKVMRRGQAVGTLTEMMYYISSETAYILLARLEYIWNDMPERQVDTHTWYYLICQLVRCVASDETTAARFKSEYANLCYLDNSATSDNTKLIKEMKRWYRSLGTASYGKLVNPVFRLLGAKSLLNEYQKSILEDFRLCNQTEKVKVEILFGAVEMTFSDTYLYGTRPEIIISTKGKDIDPLLFSDRIYSDVVRKYRIKKLVLNGSLLEENDFWLVYVYFSVRLLSVFGSDRSEIRANLLTYLTERMILMKQKLSKMQKAWQEACSQI